MKNAVVVFAIFCLFVVGLIFAVGHAHGQNLTLAEAPFDWTGYGVWLSIALTVVGIFIFVSRHPQTVRSLRASLANLTMTHKALADTHADLVETHAEVLKMAAPKPAEQQPIIRRLV